MLGTGAVDASMLVELVRKGVEMYALHALDPILRLLVHSQVSSVGIPVGPEVLRGCSVLFEDFDLRHMGLRGEEGCTVVSPVALNVAQVSRHKQKTRAMGPGHFHRRSPVQPELFRRV